MIRIQGLKKTYGKLQVLKGIDVEFERGRIISVIGPNGSGKTTLIKCILGMVLPDSGDVLLDNKSVKNEWNYRSRIGYMPQIGRYPDNMRIGQLFAMMRDLRKSGHEDEELLQSYQLPQMYDKAMRTLSGGTRQKVSAALAFLFCPDVLILDEPTAGLDPLAAEILKARILKAREQGQLVIITSHIMSEVDELADKILYMVDGQILFYKELEDLKRETGEERLGKAIARVMQTGKVHA